MARRTGAEPVYEAAELFRRRCLVEGQSLLWPENSSWTVGTIDALLNALGDDPGGGTFLGRLRDQLADQPDDVLRVAADVLAFYFLFPISKSVGSRQKLKSIQAIVDWRPDALAIAPDEREMLEAAFAEGIGSTGQDYQTGRPAHLVFLLSFARGVLERQADPYDADSCRRLIDAVGPRLNRRTQARHVLLHLLFPDQFEGIASAAHKQKIVAAFKDDAGGAQDLDDALANIRRALTERLGRDNVGFYEPDVRPIWDTAVWLFQANPDVWNLAEDLRSRREGDDDTWLVSRFRDEMGPGEPVVLWQAGTDAGIYALAELVDVPFERPTATFRPDRDKRGETEWAVPYVYTRILDRPIPKTELLNRPILKDLSVILAPQGANFKVTAEQWRAIQELVDRPDGIAPANWWVEKTKIDGWPYRQAGEYAVGRAIVAPPAASDGRDLYRNVRRVRPGDVVLHFTDTKAFTGWSRAAGPAHETTVEPGFDVHGDRALIVPLTDYRPIDPPLTRDVLFAPPYADRLMNLYRGGGQGTDAFFQVEDGQLRLKPQSYVTPATPELVAVLKDAYRAQTGLPFGPDLPDATPEPLPPTLDDLAALTHMERSELEELEALLLDKRQLVLEGPPGSGKTFLAEHFARYFAGLPLQGEPDERVETVQFHQSYGYEDFVQGIRPVTDEHGQLQYHVLPGIFMRLCELAARNPERRFVLIIDEINRGNLSRIFGELLLLLEYRDKRVRLPYGAVDGKAEQTYLTIPSNLYLIGTMNSTDRSLALIDYALRRRFFFFRLLPVAEGRAPVLEGWLVARGVPDGDRERILRLFTNLNREIERLLSPEFQIGHSYFMREDIAAEAGLRRVWKRAIQPLLEEYLHGARDRDAVLADLTPERLLAIAASEEEPEVISADEK